MNSSSTPASLVYPNGSTMTHAQGRTHPALLARIRKQISRSKMHGRTDLGRVPRQVHSRPAGSSARVHTVNHRLAPLLPLWGRLGFFAANSQGEGLADTSNVHLEEMEEELDMVLQRLQMSLLKRQLGHREQSEPAEKSRSVSAYLKEAAKDLPNPGEPTSVYPPGHCQLLLQSIEKLLGEVKLPLGQAAARHERAKADYTVAADSLREKKDLYAAELQNLAGLEDGLDEKVKALRHFSGEAQELTESDLAESIATVKRALRRLSHEQAFREARSEMRRQCLLQKRLDYSGHYTETHGATPRSGPAVSSTPIIGYRAAA
eukprot:GHVT01094006.1.p1 GENE.GHVT01094006.1~~GHVT01094006.1.p1  ORF type:complete len:319 (-),score=51.11 GHVT01094006.1:496-1452(-)